MISNSMKYVALVVSSTLWLSACGGSGGDGPTRFAVERNSAKVSLQPLKATANTSFVNHFKNGIYTSSISQICVECTAVPASVQDNVTGVENYSTTNNQEAGVDEADRVKYDGNYLYMIANAYHDPINTMGEQDYIKVFERSQDSGLTPVMDITLPEAFFSLNGLYLQGDSLVGFGSGHFWASEPVFDIWHPVEQAVNLAFYDVGDKQSPALERHVKFDGHLISSRKIDDTLYFVSTFSPVVEGLNYGASSDEQKEHNFNTIISIDINDLMPKITINGSEQQLVSPDNCYIPEDAGIADGYDSIVTLTAMNIADPSDFHSVCVNALTHHIYASNSSIYFMGTNNDDEGVIHRFALDGDLSYVGAGQVDGHFGWQAASFRLSEYEGYLRAVTTKSTAQGPVHQLFVFNTQAQNNELPVVAHLPNEQQPGLIGKPNEDIYAVRYFNDKAYVVTFERIDPLYVIDLSVPSAPFIAGELEVPGFSSYLHPINEHLLLGVGQQVNTDAIPGNGGNNGSDVMPVTTGAKVALFDVSDPSQPVQLQSFVYEDSYTPVQWDHHGFSYLPIDDNHFRFTLPLTHWYSDGADWWQVANSLNLFEVNVLDTGAELVEKTPLQAPVATDGYYYIDSTSDRSVLHGDNVYYVHGNTVIEGMWD